MIKTECAACRHLIDSAAKVCPYCGANPGTGEKVVDGDRLLQEVFQPRELSTSETVIGYARQRQGVVIAAASIAAFVLLGLLHQFVTHRNARAVAPTPPVPLTEITDLANRKDETTPAPMPKLDFQYTGRAETMRTMIVEPGAVTPPEVIAVQQAAAAATAPKPPAGVTPPRPAPPNAVPAARSVPTARPMPPGPAARPAPRQ